MMHTVKRIFVVDDDCDFAQSLSMFLELEGFTVSIANNGEAAVERLTSEDFDLTLMDIRLPGMNGVESFFKIREIKPNSQVVMMTAYTPNLLLTSAIESGALGVLEKPFTPEKLKEMLESVKPEGIILTADDQKSNYNLLAPSLQEMGYRVLTCNPQNVIDLSQNGDILIIEPHRPVLESLEIYLTFKKHHRAMPTIIVSDYAEGRQPGLPLAHYFELHGCLVKPFDPNQLKTFIHSYFKDAQ